MIDPSEKVIEHWHEAKNYFTIDNIVGIFLQGSQNYDLATPESDVDTKLVVIPTLDDICRAKRPISTTHIRENDEHIDFKDVRLMIDIFKKQNINFIEILFTPYLIIHPDYATYWEKLIENRERIARYDLNKAVKNIKGMTLQKYHALEHPYPNKTAVLKKFGYDPKQLHHIIRLNEFLTRFLGGESYKNCLLPTDKEYLIAVKKGLYNLEDARKLALERVEATVAAADRFCEVEHPADKKMGELLEDTKAEIIKTSIRKELILK